MIKVTQHRRRDVELLAAIRDAVLAELSEHGYAGVTYEGVARRARTSKPVLYRRFASRSGMVVDALMSRIKAGLPPESTGSLRADLRRAMLSSARQLNRMGVDVLRGLFGDNDLTLMLKVADPYVTAAMGGIIADAVERGELGPKPIPEFALLAGPSLLRERILRADEPVTEELIDRILDEVTIPLLRAVSGASAG